VLVLSPRAQTLNELAERFSKLKVAGLGLRSKHSWIDAISAISRNEKAQPAALASVRATRSEALSEVESYFGELSRRDLQLEVSVAEAFEQLALLSALPKAPQNEARVPYGKSFGCSKNAALLWSNFRKLMTWASSSMVRKTQLGIRQGLKMLSR
jgi:hypothetical protein